MDTRRAAAILAQEQELLLAFEAATQEMLTCAVDHLEGEMGKREKLLAQLGLSGVPLRELEERGPREAHMETRRAVESLRRKYEVFQSASEVARNTLECNLHAIERIQRAQDAPPEEEHPRLADFRV